MGFFGGLRAPLSLFLKWTRPLCFQMVFDLVKVIPFLTTVQPSGNTPSSPRPPLKETLLAPQQGFLGVGSCPNIPLHPYPCPGPWPKSGLATPAGGYQPWAL